MLADLLNVPTTPEDWQVWGNSHNLEHQAILQRVVALGGPSLTQYILYPVFPERLDEFLEQNQSAHTDVASVLRLNSSDLQELDQADQQQLIAWIQIHHQEHQAIAQRLGMG